MFFTISGGAASFNTQEDSYEDVLKNAKFALHVSKLMVKTPLHHIQKMNIFPISAELIFRKN